jgi:ribosomal protein S6--L-glutamate ligase
LYIFRPDAFKTGNQDMVRFYVHPLQNKAKIKIACAAPILDKGFVRDSGGHIKEHYVIYTVVILGTRKCP